MELLINDVKDSAAFTGAALPTKISTAKPFIEANTIESSYEEIKDNHIIPVFVKDNEALISHSDFIDIAATAAGEIYASERILSPSVRLSHPIKGRIPSARDKAAIALQEHEKTLYYERMAFVIEIPSIQDEIEGNRLSLVVGGVKSYNMDNLYGRKGSDEHFKIFIGFQNKVCTNMCIWSDGLQADLKVKDAGQLQGCIKSLFQSFNASYQLFHLRRLSNYSITEQQFALMIGRCRMYGHLPRKVQAEIPPLRMGDSQINTVVNNYYNDRSFCRMQNGEINLWRLYNLFTSANKSTYIDSFLERSVNAYHFVGHLRRAIQHKSDCWFLN